MSKMSGLVKLVKLWKELIEKKFYRVEVWMDDGLTGKLVIHHGRSRAEVIEWIECYDSKDDIRVENWFGKEIYRDWSFDWNIHYRHNSCVNHAYGSLVA